MRDLSAQSPVDSPAREVFYPRLVRRVRAHLIDEMVVLAVVAAWLALLPWMQEWSPAQRILVLFGLLLLAEPCLVSWTGGTIGHHVMRLRVRDAHTERNLGLIRATLRALLRLMLGWLSLLFILLTRRRQALHDVLLNSVVVIGRPKGLPAYDLIAALPFHLERAAGMPSRWRRMLIVLVYLLAATVAVSVTAGQLISSQCSSNDVCTRAEEVAQAVLGWAWLAAVVVIVVLGVRGRLWGARRKPLLD
jgi:uncharacterized RDD family membrane protein YckC